MGEKAWERQLRLEKINASQKQKAIDSCSVY